MKRPPNTPISNPFLDRLHAERARRAGGRQLAALQALQSFPPETFSALRLLDDQGREIATLSPSDDPDLDALFEGVRKAVESVIREHRAKLEAVARGEGK